MMDFDSFIANPPKYEDLKRVEPSQNIQQFISGLDKVQIRVAAQKQLAQKREGTFEEILIKSDKKLEAEFEELQQLLKITLQRLKSVEEDNQKLSDVVKRLVEKQ